MQSEKLNGVLRVVFVLCLKNIVYYLSQHTYRYIETASCFCSLQPASCHQYGFLNQQYTLQCTAFPLATLHSDRMKCALPPQASKHALSVEVPSYQT